MINSLGYNIPDKSIETPWLHPKLDYQKILILFDSSKKWGHKTVRHLMRYRQSQILGFVEINGNENAFFGLPSFKNINSALSLNPDAIIVGAGNPKYNDILEPIYFKHIIDAVNMKIDILNLSHTLLRKKVQNNKILIQDIRDDHEFCTYATKKVVLNKQYRIMSCGVDCSTGKMTTMFELRKSAVDSGINAMFVPTGQTGILLDEWGLCTDHAMADYIAGMTEFLVSKTSQSELLFVEGQGSPLHPSFCGLTLSMLTGCCPDSIIMSYRNIFYHQVSEQNKFLEINMAPGRMPAASLKDQIEFCEFFMKTIYPTKVIAVSLNGIGINLDAKENQRDYIVETTGLPCIDPIGDERGANKLLEIILEHKESKKRIYKVRSPSAAPKKISPTNTVFCIIMGRGGSNALPRWIFSQYPQSLNAQYETSDAVHRMPLVKEYFRGTREGFFVFRQEAINLLFFKNYKNNEQSNDNHKIIVYSLRDPWNYFAALLKFWRKIPHPESYIQHRFGLYVNGYKTFLEQATGKKQYLPENSIFVNYNTWVQEPQYRKNLTNTLGLPPTDNNIHKIWKKSAFDTNAHSSLDLSLFDRWKYFVKDPIYASVFQDIQLIEMSEQLFEKPKGFYID